MSESLRSNGPLAPYRSPGDRQRTVDALADALGADTRTLGESVEGRPIHVVRVPGGDADVLVTANIHGVEYIATEVALGVLRYLTQLEGSSQVGEALDTPAGLAGELRRLRERATIWVLPTINPDAYAATWDAGGDGTLKQLRTNARGVDLNRNFPLPAPQRPVWFDFGGWRTGSDDPQNEFYRGESPLSEPETAAVARLLDEVAFRAGVGCHSTMGTTIPPNVNSRADYAVYKRLCRAFRNAQPHTRYHRMGSFHFDRFTGELEDFQHAEHGTWAICVEHYALTTNISRFIRRPTLFWRFNPRDPAHWIANDVPGIVAFFHAALDLDG